MKSYNSDDDESGDDYAIIPSVNYCENEVTATNYDIGALSVRRSQPTRSNVSLPVKQEALSRHRNAGNEVSGKRRQAYSNINASDTDATRLNMSDADCIRRRIE